MSNCEGSSGGSGSSDGIGTDLFEIQGRCDDSFEAGSREAGTDQLPDLEKRGPFQPSSDPSPTSESNGCYEDDPSGEGEPDGNTPEENEPEATGSDGYLTEGSFSEDSETSDDEDFGLEQAPTPPYFEPPSTHPGYECFIPGGSGFKAQVNKVQSRWSLKPSVYFLHTSYRELGQRRPTGATAIYIGKGLFLTAAHNLQILNDWKPVELYVKKESSDVGKLHVLPAGFMDKDLDQNNLFPSDYQVNPVEDVALLKLREQSDCPTDESAANPFIAQHDTRTHGDRLPVRFCGINFGLGESARQRYADILPTALDEALQALQPRRISTAKGYGAFANFDTRTRTLTASTASDADLLTYDISTVEGASGSAITNSRSKLNRELFHKPKLMGIHRGFDPYALDSRDMTETTCNWAVNLNGPRFRNFFTRCTAEMVRNDRETFSGWKWMKVRTSD